MIERPILAVFGVSKTYPSRHGALPVLQDVSLVVCRSELCAIKGASGSGKSTLMSLIGLLDRPDAGRIEITGLRVDRLGADEQARLRNRLIGFVFQSFNLLPGLSAHENVALPLLYRGVSRPARRDIARSALARVGLQDRIDHRPNQMSGGQCQRVAIARALAGQPAVILADEPTGSLDTATSESIMNLFLDLNRNHGTTIILVTHDPTVAARCPRRIVVSDGRVVDDNRDELRDAGPC